MIKYKCRYKQTSTLNFKRIMDTNYRIGFGTAAIGRPAYINIKTNYEHLPLTQLIIEMNENH